MKDAEDVRKQIHEVMASITEDCKAICRTAAERCLEESETMDKQAAEFAAEFGVAFVRSTLRAALARRAKGYFNEAACECVMGAIPPICDALCY